MVGGVDFQGDEPLMNRQVVNLGAIDGLSRAVKEENIVFSTYDKTVAVGESRSGLNQQIPCQA
jgi:hypothetical protein